MNANTVMDFRWSTMIDHDATVGEEEGVLWISGYLWLCHLLLVDDRRGIEHRARAEQAKDVRAEDSWVEL